MIDDDEFLDEPDDEILDEPDDEPDESGYRSSPKRKELATQLAYHAGRLQREGVPPAEVRQFLQGFTVAFLEKPRMKPKQCGSGLKGTRSNGDRWCGQIRFKGKNLYLGTFDTPEEAHQAYRQKHIELHGEKSPYHPANQSTEAAN